MLRFVVIEVRQHLCCANVFLNFQQSITDFDSVRINVEDGLIRVKDSTDSTVVEVKVAEYFTILTETFSNLLVDQENISFRISVQNVKDLSQYGKGSSHSAPAFQLEEGQSVSLHCKQCESTLCGSQRYSKVREFPSGSIDISEFFCHHGPSFNDVLLPRIADIFYGFQFVIINMENIRNASKEREQHLYCKRCSRYLGETLFEGKAAKLWTDSIAMKREDDIETTDLFNVAEHNLLQLLMLKVINETSLPSPEPLLRNMHFTKVLLETSLANRKPRYLLVQILEKNLPVLKNDDELQDVERKDADTLIHLLNVELGVCQAFKLLYRLIESEHQPNDNCDDVNGEVDENEPPMLSYWQQDINILKLKISPFLFHDLLDELNCNSLLLPEIYRNNKDSFTLSYIFQ
ncbi:uncharacterized protein LOC133326374 [Musca vetustissima]|uniref:uncharacterized protein LOC133326374 n=1 Tax=Musca vetustissima TaxID=27455 RepID=UPI002AB6FF7B|nr:uncharacterized protein LOC133326374 [Musca vetustissima]